MGLIWDQAESAAFQNALSTNLDVWDTALSSWRTRLDAVAERLGSDPNSDLSGAAWNAAKTLFIDRILPIVETGQSACAWTREHLQTYKTAEVQLIQDDTHLDEEALQSSIDALNAEVYEITSFWELVWPWIGYREDVRALRRRIKEVEKKIDDLRIFSSSTSSLFNEEIALTYTLSTAIESISRGSLSVDGIYMPSSGDREPWRQGLSTYLTYHPASTDDQAIADVMEQKLRDKGLLEGPTNSWYEKWLLNAAKHNISIDEILKIAADHGITPEDFSLLDGLEEVKDPDGKSYFLLPKDIDPDDAVKAVLMIYILNAGTDYATADDHLNNSKASKNDYSETPYSSAEIQRIINRQEQNRGCYNHIDGSGAVVATPNGMLIGVGGNIIQQMQSRSGGTTYGDFFLTNIDNSSDPAQTLKDLITAGKRSDGLDLDRLLHHEERHSQQWATYGAGFAITYIGDLVKTGFDGTKNQWEQDAGLADGGYVK